MKPVLSRQRQRGAALMAMLAVLILGATWWTVTAFSNPVNRTAEQRAQNAQVLQQAKAALIGWVAHQAAMAAEADPGRLPCPELVANVGTANQGLAPIPNGCALPAVGRLPWRTLGLDQLRDASGEPLWYVVSAGWTNPAAGVNTAINSNTFGQLALDSAVANDVVALIIAPGAPLQIPASANCAARNQTRTVVPGAIDLRNYLECHNATFPADFRFATTDAAGPFNDQVLAITGAELMPVLEAAVAHRFQRDIAPQVRTAYSTGLWAATPALPFAAPFGDPTAAPFRLFQGTAGMMRGLLPVSYSYTGPCACGPGVPCTCTPAACDPATDFRCDPAFVAWSAAATTITRVAGVNLHSFNCAVAGTPTLLTCTINLSATVLQWVFGSTMTFNLDAVALNAGMALRTINDPSVRAPAMTGIDTTFVNNPVGYAVTAVLPTMPAVLNNDGSARIRVNARLPGGGTVVVVVGCGPVCLQHTITLPMALFSDHPVVDPSNAATNWFFRNNWHQVSYYAVSSDVAPSANPRACNANCFTVNFNNAVGPHQALIVISGRSLSGTLRPNGTVTDWLEDINCNLGVNPSPPPANTCLPGVPNPPSVPVPTFAARAPAQSINRTFNDRIAIIAP